MSITGSFIMPHPPIILPEIGRGEETKIQRTIAACEFVAEIVAGIKPDTIVLTSPHSIMYSDYFHISPGKAAKGNLGRFSAPEVSINAEYDKEFVTALEKCAEISSIPAGTLGEKDSALDHGTIIPLSFINKKYNKYKLVRMGLSGLPLDEHYKLGMCIADASQKLNRNVVIIASGDLSHKVSENSPYGFAPEGVAFDSEVTKAMSTGDFMRFLTFSPEFTEKAAECGLRSFIIMAGALDGRDVESQLLSYEGIFGVGYGVASFIPTDEQLSHKLSGQAGEQAIKPKIVNKERKFLDKFYKLKAQRLSSIIEKEDEYVRLARYSLEHYVKTGNKAALPENLNPLLLSERAGVFVSLKKHGALRGCIGTISPVTDSIGKEILRNAVSAGTQDPRFPPVGEAELSQLVYSVDVLSPPEPIDSVKMLDVKQYGVIVSKGRKKGLLLPNIEGVDTVEQQISISLQKAGIRPDEEYTLARFKVVRHT